LMLMIHVKLTLEFVENTKTEIKVGALFFKDEEAIELSFDEAFREFKQYGNYF
ncbi:hypothetical protein DOY81_010242, partial [Sarcophaga bullata]